MKKNQSLYVSNVYTVYDKVGKRYIGLFYAPTDEAMIRTSLPSILLDYPLRDINVVCIGQFDELRGEIVSSAPKYVDVSCYTFPHSRLSSVGDDLDFGELDEYMKKVKSEQVAKSSDFSASSDSPKVTLTSEVENG